jgi:hypothetical protein
VINVTITMRKGVAVVDWNKALYIGAQCVVLVVLGVLVGLGHDSTIMDGLMVVSGSLAGVGGLQVLPKSKTGT